MTIKLDYKNTVSKVSMISTSINKLYSLNCFLYTTYDTTRTTEPTPRAEF